MFNNTNLKHWFWFVVNFAVIFYLSSLEGGGNQFLPFESSDKALHFSIYFLLGVNFARAIYHQNRFWRLNYRWFWLGLFLAPLFAASDEWHQSFVVGRSVEFFDGVADVSGFLLAMFVFQLTQITATKKRFLPLVEMREKIWVYRLDMSWMFLVVLIWDFYFIQHKLYPSTLTFYFGPENFFLIWQTLLGLILGGLWVRFWFWECWWQNKLKSKSWVTFGFVIGILILLFEGWMRWQNQLQARVVLAHILALLGFTSIYWIYCWGWSWIQIRKTTNQTLSSTFVCELPKADS